MKIEKTTLKEITVAAPPAKAYTLRAILLGGLASGTTIVKNPLLAADQMAMIDSLKRLGISIRQELGSLHIKGGGGRFQPVKDLLNVNESGVGMNFLISAASLAGKPVILTGKPGLLKRPVGELVQGLEQLGCCLEYLEKQGFPPVKNPGTGIHGGTARMSGAKNSQYFSSIAISAPYAETKVTLECVDDMTEKPYFDITLEMMEHFGIKAVRNEYRSTCIPGDTVYSATEITMEGDYSSASYFFTTAAVCRNKVHVTGLNPASLQGDKRLLEMLEKMGCKVERTADTITVTGGDLKAIETEMADVPDMVPSLAVAAAFAEGTTVIKKVGHLRFKECNRLEAVVTNFRNMGISAHYDDTSLYIKGSKKIKGANIDTYNDHRIAMSFAIAGLACGDVVIDNPACVGKSFPDFWERLKEFY